MTTGDSTCWTMIRAAAAGNDRDRDAFARHYLPVIRSYLLFRWKGSPLVSEVEDAVQDVFFDCFRPSGALARADSTRPGGFRAFLHGVVRNVSLRRERTAARRRERNATDSELEARGESREGSLSEAFDRAWARSILQQAAERQRERASTDAARRRIEVLHLRFEEGLPIREIAARHERDPAKVHKDYAKARDDFRAALLEVVEFHHPGSRRDVEGEAARLVALIR